MTSISQSFATKTSGLYFRSEKILLYANYQCLALLLFPINSGQTQPQTNTQTNIQQSRFNSIDVAVKVRVLLKRVLTKNTL